MLARLRLLLPLLFAAAPVHAAPVHAATLAQALYHWTGLTADVIGRGPHVTVQLPPKSPVPMFTALAEPAARAGDQGWRLTQIAVPLPLRLRDGDTLTLRSQTASAWLGDRTVQEAGDYTGIALMHGRETMRLDHASLALDSSGGPATVTMALDGPHLDRPGPLLPSHATLDAHTTPAGAEALGAILAGRPGAAVPLTIDQAAFDIGPAHFTATGAVTLVDARNRNGALTVTGEHFGDLLRHMPTDQYSATAYPILMILRQIGQKSDGHLTWSLTFAGRQVLIGGFDIAPLMGGL